MVVSHGGDAVDAAPAFAELTAVDQQYVEQLIKGGPGTLRQVAENMYNTGYRNTEVLDVMAEVVLEKYPLTGGEFTNVDSIAWMCRALGASGNNRYRPVLEKVSDDKTVHRKLRGHCEKASKQLPKGVENSYVAGTVNLELLRNPPPPPPPPAPANAKGKKNAKPAAAKPAAKPAAAAPPRHRPHAAAPAAQGRGSERDHDRHEPAAGQRLVRPADRADAAHDRQAMAAVQLRRARPAAHDVSVQGRRAASSSR